MRKRASIAVLLALLLGAAAASIAWPEGDIIPVKITPVPQTADQKMAAFEKELLESAQAQDPQKVLELMKRTEPSVVFNYIIRIAQNGLDRRASGKEADAFFVLAEGVAGIYGLISKKEGLAELVRRYRAYTPDMYEKMLNGHVLMREGIDLYRKEQWEKSLDKLNRAASIFDGIGDVSGKATALVHIGMLHEYRRRPKDAVGYHRQALEISRSLGDLSGEALALDSLGSSWRALGQHDEALECYRESLEIHRKNGDLDGQAQTLMNISSIRSVAFGGYHEALDLDRQALEIYRLIGDEPGQVEALRAIGSSCRELGRFREALDAYEQAIAICRQSGDLACQTDVILFQGAVHQHLGRFAQALESYQKALELCRSLGDPTGEAQALFSIGSYHQLFGRYAKARDHFERAFELFGRTGEPAFEHVVVSALAVLLDGMGQTEQAVGQYQKALEMSRRAGLAQGEILALAGLGGMYHRLGRHEQALTYGRQALEKARGTLQEPICLLDVGEALSGLGRPAEALEHYRQSLEIARRMGEVAGEALSLNKVGSAHDSLGQPAEAIRSFQDAVKLSERLGLPGIAWSSHRGLGMSLWKSGRPAEAVAPYAKAIETIEAIYRETAGLREEERASMIGMKQHVYKEFIDLLLELHGKHPLKGYDAQAFIVSERAKSRVFQELMAKAGARTAFAGDAAFAGMIEKEQELIGELASLQGLFSQEMSKGEERRNEEVVRSLEEQIGRARKALGELDKEIDVKYPRYADLKRPQPLTVKDLQSVLEAGETVVSYALGKNKAAAHVISREGFRMRELGTGPQELADLVLRFRRGLDDVRSLEDLERFRPEVAFDLYGRIFGPVEPDLEKAKRIFVAADGVLHTLPFEALVDREVDLGAFRQARRQGRDGEGAYLGEYGTLRYLADTYAITYLPSASVLRSLRKFEKPGYGAWTKPLVAFADPIFGPEEAVTGGEREVGTRSVSPETELMAHILTRATGAGGLARLEESADEAKAIAEEVDGKAADIHLRREATEENVHRSDLKASRYVLFSTHGLLGGDFSGVAEPALVLTLTDNPPGRDGFLTMSKVLGLDLNAELVILSACNTSGKGDKAGEGEGFVGLTRSFMYAGAKSLLVTHWSVESRAARDLMVWTARNKAGAAGPEALRSAKLAMKASTREDAGVPGGTLSLAHPFFWAPFVIVGEGR
jgi:tetratricopeptide (TPR) repeat protein/CHAT domain-containing protein